jgi:hypothetical protein
MRQPFDNRLFGVAREFVAEAGSGRFLEVRVEHLHRLRGCAWIEWGFTRRDFEVVASIELVSFADYGLLVSAWILVGVRD